MRRLIQILTLSLLIIFPSRVLSQVSVTNYSIFYFGLNTNQERRISGDLKIISYPYSTELQADLGLFFNFKPREYHRFSIGLSATLLPLAGYDYIYAINMPFQLEIFPLQQFKRLSLVYELSPIIIVESNVGIRNLFGVRYTFKKRKEETISEKE